MKKVALLTCLLVAVLICGAGMAFASEVVTYGYYYDSYGRAVPVPVSYYTELRPTVSPAQARATRNYGVPAPAAIVVNPAPVVVQTAPVVVSAPVVVQEAPVVVPAPVVVQPAPVVAPVPVVVPAPVTVQAAPVVVTAPAPVAVPVYMPAVIVPYYFPQTVRR